MEQLGSRGRLKPELEEAVIRRERIVNLLDLGRTVHDRRDQRDRLAEQHGTARALELETKRCTLGTDGRRLLRLLLRLRRCRGRHARGRTLRFAAHEEDSRHQLKHV